MQVIHWVIADPLIEMSVLYLAVSQNSNNPLLVLRNNFSYY
jgi:hypothetical protein